MDINRRSSVHEILRELCGIKCIDLAKLGTRYTRKLQDCIRKLSKRVNNETF